jgi:hypothetical protein
MTLSVASSKVEACSLANSILPGIISLISEILLSTLELSNFKITSPSIILSKKR